MYILEYVHGLYDGAATTNREIAMIELLRLKNDFDFFFAPLQFPFTSAKKLIYFPRQLLLFQFSPFIPRQITIFVYMLLADMWDPIKYIHSLSLKSEIR